MKQKKYKQLIFPHPQTQAALASKTVEPDAIDKCILNNMKGPERLKQYEQLDFLPFDPVAKRTEATIKGPDGKTFKVSKGAPQVILNMAKNKDTIKAVVSLYFKSFLFFFFFFSCLFFSCLFFSFLFFLSLLLHTSHPPPFPQN